MIFWRNKKNQKEQEQEKDDHRLLHRKHEAELEPSTDAPDPVLDESNKHIVQDPDEAVPEKQTPTPAHNEKDDIVEAKELSDHSNEGGWFSKLTKGLSKSSNKLGQGIADIFTKKKLDDETLEELEELLITADLGPATASTIVEEIRSERFGKDIEPEEIKTYLASKIEAILEPVAHPILFEKAENGPMVVLVSGVNGAGKTTTIGKIAHDLHYNQGKKVMLAAGDTFRAAAIGQLHEWAERAGASFVSKEIGADAAAVAYEAYEQAKEQNIDILFIDTAGRLQNKANLMEELAKMVRVLKKQDENLPHACLLVLDATTGQNAVSQVKTFKEIVDVTGLIVTKLDGSAKGGVLVSLADQFGLPVHMLGVGEKLEDLQPFTAEEFSKSLLGIE